MINLYIIKNFDCSINDEACQCYCQINDSATKTARYHEIDLHKSKKINVLIDCGIYIILYNITDNGTNVYLRLNHEYLKKLSF